MNDIWHIVYCGDADYIPFIGISMTSVVFNNIGANIVFHIVLENTIHDEDKEKLRAFQLMYRNVAQLKVYFLGNREQKEIDVFRKVQSGYPIASWYRFFIPELLDKHIQKVLYLDGDVICCGSLNDLWHMKLEQPLGMVVDVNEKNNIMRMGNGVKEYYNAGVSLYNLDLWRRDNLFADVLCMAEEMHAAPYADQDIINRCFQGKIARLPEKYNRQIPCNLYVAGEDVDIDPEDCLLHYVSGGTRPWEIKCLDRKARFWIRYKDKSFWDDFKLQGTELMRIKIECIRSLLKEGNPEAKTWYKEILKESKKTGELSFIVTEDR